MLSIVIPTLNAETTLPRTLGSIGAPDDLPVQVIVVDGGSTDATPALARQGGARVLASAPGRGRQLAAGADATETPWLLFLHADSTLPRTWAADVRRFIDEQHRADLAAYFQLRFDTDQGGAARVAALANWRARTLALPYGDQGLLIHRDLYTDVGGYRVDQPLMEDVDLVRRIGPMRLRPLRSAITSSAARYQRDGWWARPMRNLACLSLYLLGVSPQRLKALYK